MPKRFTEIAEIMGIDTRGLTQREAGNRAVAFVNQLSEDIGIPKRLRNIGITEDEINLISQTALEDACMITNPRDMDFIQVKTLLENIL